MILDLPWPPTVNHYWKRNRNGSVRVSDEGDDYRELVAGIVRARGLNRGLTCRLRVEVEAFPPDKRARDLDNLFKCLLDAMAKAGVYASDSQIDDLRIVREAPDTKWPRVRVKVQERGP